MNPSKPSILKFSLATTEAPLGVLRRFFPGGANLLNRTEWRGKPPRTCGITSVKSRQYSAGSREPVIFDIEVTHKPMGFISYVGSTKYDGWTAMMLNQASDGTLLDRDGNPLPDGELPIYLPFEVHNDIEFNDIDFGEFVSEIELSDVRHVPYEDVVKRIERSSSVDASIRSSFVAPRKHRPLVKVILSEAASGVSADQFGTRVVNVHAYTPQLEKVIADEVTEVVRGFVEGRYSLNSTTTDTFTLVDLSGVFVDCRPNQTGADSRFDCLNEFVEEDFLTDLTKLLMATYELEVSIVDGKGMRLLLEPKPRTR